MGEKFDQPAFFERLLQFLASEAPERLTMSRVARATGVPRATLYYYFGASVEKLLVEAMRSGTRTVLQATRSKEIAPHASYLAYMLDLMHATHTQFAERPWGLPLYFRFRHAPGAYGQVVRDVEAEYLRQQHDVLRHFGLKAPTDEQLRSLISLRVAAVYSVVDSGLRNQEEIYLIFSELARSMLATFSADDRRPTP